MKTYWDYTEQERANMAQEAVTSLIDIELMAAGVLKPTAPILTPVASVPVGSKCAVYTPQGKGKYGSLESIGVSFTTMEAAQKFMELCPVIRDYDYECGSEFSYFKSVSDFTITPEELYTQEQINAFRSALKQRKAATEENERLTSAFNAASAKADQATKGVWSDWYGCTAKKQTLAGIVETFKQYVALAQGDQFIAFGFLKKAFSADDIAAANEWFPNVFPDLNAPTALPVEQASQASK